jgi:endonuclease YncB( thermonuclease family)
MFLRPWTIGRTRERGPGGVTVFLFVLGLVLGSLLIGPRVRPPSSDPLLSELSQLTGPYPARLVRVVDGDTFEARVQAGSGGGFAVRVRLRSIDAPELNARCHSEYERAVAARRALAAILAEGDLRIWNVGPDKYDGRIVAEAATRRTPDVSQAMRATGHVRRYAGGQRQGWC